MTTSEEDILSILQEVAEAFIGTDDEDKAGRAILRFLAGECHHLGIEGDNHCLLCGECVVDEESETSE